jgi:PII-like signaling protein
MLPKEGHLLHIFVGEADRRGRIPLYEWIVREAHKHEFAGATVLRGVEGFGAKSHLHKVSILRLSADLPIVVEIVDTREKIESFLPVIDAAITDGLATI